ncbi:MAG: hypothetical protein L0Y61_03305 [Epsilonproteobacteria bacterium]|nr:hypothetical protein [Campylobacterota bacterium]
MKKLLSMTLLCVGFGLFLSGCETKSTDEQLKENTAKEAELLKKSVSEKTSAIEKDIKEDIDQLKK